MREKIEVDKKVLENIKNDYLRVEMENDKLRFIIKMLEEQIKIMREFWEE